MNRTDLELYIRILEEHSIAKAADLLYLAPSTVGARLKLMEQELGFELLERKKGAKTVLPTPKGEEFSKIAHNMLALWNECDQLSVNQESPLLTIATVDSFLEHNLSPFYQSLIQKEPGFMLNIKCYPADMIYALVSKKQADAGFALYHTAYPHVVVTPLISDDMVLVIPETSSFDRGPVHPGDLPAGRELLVGSRQNSNIGWGPEFKVWHDSWFGLDCRPMVTATSISILSGFLEAEDYWMIAPRTTALGYQKRFPLRILSLKPAPPKRTLYMLTHQFPSQISKLNTELFITLLKNYLTSL